MSVTPAIRSGKGQVAQKGSLLFNHPVPSDYRLSPSLRARLLGLTLVGLGLLVVVAAVLVGVFAFPASILLGVAVFCLVTILVVWFALTRTAYVVRLGEEGYHVRFVRGAGVTRGRWKDVEDAVTTSIAGAPCVVLRLRDGRSTTIPVTVLKGNRESFARDLQDHLQRGQGLRRL